MIKLFHLPGVRDIENAQVLFNRIGGDEDTLGRQADEVSVAIFGITREDAMPEVPDESVSDEEYEAWEEWLGGYLKTDLSGWDFNDDLGRELLCLRHFSHQVLAVTAGWKGKMPDVAGANAALWGDKLAEEAKRFKRKT